MSASNVEVFVLVIIILVILGLLAYAFIKYVGPELAKQAPEIIRQTGEIIKNATQ